MSSVKSTQRGILVVFVLLCVGAFVWAGRVVEETRAAARTTDECLRTAAWMLLCYADSHEGQFPGDEATFWLAVQGGELACSSVQGGTAEGAWPASRDAAGATLLEDLQLVRRSVTVSLAEAPTDGLGEPPPILGTPGKPSGLGTLETVNGWLRSRAMAGNLSGARGAAEGG